MQLSYHGDEPDIHHQTSLTIIISLGDQKETIPHSQFLSHVWNSGSDTACRACERHFTQDIDPVIRTIPFDISEASQPTSSNSGGRHLHHILFKPAIKGGQEHKFLIQRLHGSSACGTYCCVRPCLWIAPSIIRSVSIMRSSS